MANFIREFFTQIFKCKGESSVLNQKIAMKTGTNTRKKNQSKTQCLCHLDWIK